VTPVAGVLNAALAAAEQNRGLICPAGNGPEAAFAGGVEILATPSLIGLVNHMKGASVLAPPVPRIAETARAAAPDLRDVKGQESAKRALEIAAAGGHNLLMIGPPGAGKSMLAQRLPGILPPLSASELLETSMVHSIAGHIAKGALTRARPFRAPHHSASMAALTGGGIRVKPGEVSLAHNGVLFLDELPEFSAQALDALRAPLETGEVIVARANAHIRYPARVQIVAAMNPCKCGFGGLGRGSCGRAPRCQQQYQTRVSGPFLDRIDLQIEVPPVTAADLSLPPPSEGTAEAAARVAQARALQAERAAGLDGAPTLNARLEGESLEKLAALDDPARALLAKAAQGAALTARGWTRTIRLARTIADLDGADAVRRIHIAEALIYRRVGTGLEGVLQSGVAEPVNA
jgi:magnesium chelatase family protein